MTSEPDTSISEETAAAVEALARWECNRLSKAVKDRHGASSWFHECLPVTQESYRKWAKDVLNFIERIRPA